VTADTDPAKPPRRWRDAPDTMLALAEGDLAADRMPMPSLVAFAGDDALAIATLRPFEEGEVVQALLELLALLLPVGTDRVALALPARVWSLEDPIPPVTADVDLRTRVVLVITADAHGQACQVTTSLHPYEIGEDGCSWLEPVRPDEAPTAPVVAALSLLLDDRDKLVSDAQEDDLRLAAQFGRVLLRGHELALSPALARRLEVATTC